MWLFVLIWFVVVVGGGDDDDDDDDVVVVVVCVGWEGGGSISDSIYISVSLSFFNWIKMKWFLSELMLAAIIPDKIVCRPNNILILCEQENQFSEQDRYYVVGTSY